MSTVRLKEKPRKGGAGIYALVAKSEGGKVYIGETIDLYRRFRDHRAHLDRRTHCNSKLQYIHDTEEELTFVVLKEVWYDFNKPKTHIKPLLKFWGSFYMIKYSKYLVNIDAALHDRATKMLEFSHGDLSHYLNPTKAQLVNKCLANPFL